MRKALFIALVFSLLAPFQPARADFSLKDWASVRDITVPAITNAAYVRFTLPPAVAAGSTLFKDLRVIRETDGREVPYQLVVKDASVTAAFLSSRVIDVATDSGGRLMFILDAGSAGSLHSRLQIESARENYRRQVSVYGADTLLPHSSSGWNLLTDLGYIFKFSDLRVHFTTARGEVDYPESSTRYLRVVVESGPEGSLSLLSAGVYRYEEVRAEEETGTVLTEVNERAPEQTTEVIADMGASGIPTQRIELSVADRGNFSRSAFVFGSQDGTAWARLGQGYLSQIDTVKFRGASLSLEYPESTYRYYKVTVQNFDDAPLRLERLAKVTSTTRIAVFEAEPGESYELYYGNSSAYTPRYDLARYFAYLDTRALPEVTLDGERENASYVPPAPPVVPFTERNKVLLNITLAVLALLIGAFIFWYIWRHLHPHAQVVSAQTPLPVPPVFSPSKGNEMSEQ